MYQVLAAHDLSGRSEVALVRAARLTIEREGYLTILHVVDGDLVAPMIEALRAEAETYLELEVRRWLGRDKPPYRIEVVAGDPADAIARATTRRIARLRSGANVACATAAAGFESLLLMRGELWRRAVHASQVSQAAPSGGVTENQRDDQQH